MQDRHKGTNRSWNALAGLLLLPVGLACWHGGNLAADRLSTATGGPLWISESPVDDATRLLIVVDQEGRRTAIYHVDAASGALTLRSTRDISWDLMVGDFNAQEPRPAALQRMLQLPRAEGAR